MRVEYLGMELVELGFITLALSAACQPRRKERLYIGTGTLFYRERFIKDLLLGYLRSIHGTLPILSDL